MARWGQILMVAALASATPSLARAEGYPSVDAAHGRAARALREAQIARGNVEQTRVDYEELTHRIRVLKEGKGTIGRRQVLDGLLKESVDAQQRLETVARTAKAKMRIANLRLKEAVRLVNQEMRRLRPGLHAKDPQTKRRSAKALAKLVELRNQLKAERASLQPQPVEQLWRSYEAQAAIDPLDGPEDLGEKADFVEDTRDKFRRKRQALLKLISEAQQEQEIARTNINFQTNANLFDEPQRSQRIARSSARQSAAEGRSVSDNKSAGGETSGTGGTAAPQAPGNEEAFEPNSGQSAPPPAADPSGGGGAPAFTAGVQDDATNRASDGDIGSPASPTVGQPPSARAPDIAGAAAAQLQRPRQLNPNTLLNLDIAGLQGQRVELEKLQALVKQLDMLDRSLSQKATNIRRRAKRLQEDETKALGIK